MILLASELTDFSKYFQELVGTPYRERTWRYTLRFCVGVEPFRVVHSRS